MTNEEAIRILIRLKDQINFEWTDAQKKMDALNAAIEALNAQQWIPCEERLPKKDEEVLVYLFGDSPYIAWHDGVDWCTEDFTVDKDEEPLAWMPLPKPWKGEQNE